MSGQELASAIVRLGALTLDFSRIDRITYHQDGVTPESDADHTVMLGTIGCALAARWYPWLDVGLVAQYALAHDVVEVYAGDTPTLRALSADGKAAKVERERAAQERITREFGGQLAWLPDIIARYELRGDPESCFVKALDKLLPKITHILNGARTIRQQGVSRGELVARYVEQLGEIRVYAEGFTELLDLRDRLVEMVLEALDSEVGPC